MKPILLFDPGHGDKDYTSGKYSPIVKGMPFAGDPSIYKDRYREGAGNRLMVAAMIAEAKKRGYTAINIVPEEKDISLTERCRRVNAYCDKYGSQNCLLISVHSNTAGNAVEWHTARGWLSIVDDYASARAKTFSEILFDTVASCGYKTRRPNSTRKYYYYRELIGKSVRLAMLKGTKCPAVLTENFFYTSKEDLAFLASSAGRAAIAKYHLDAVDKYAGKYK